MSGYTVVVGNCPPGKDCPKVVRSPTGALVIVGARIIDPAALNVLGVGPEEAAVEITEAMFREAAEVLSASAETV